ncbi:MAG: hypothetical protein LBJ15_14615 [Comamonas sp.]|jgi:hypothetical protein|uniref:hypothetical protein n=1 Tax=Comamonas sp. TaxID=34028 RepID=UPI002829555D|nr:hypothetical protein [Comamonas sp.]MDR0215224.1 hypothetical protein [Comamonas sp.]
MQKALLWAGRSYRSCALFFLVIGLCASASSTELPNPVREFAKNLGYCYYMVAPPGSADDEFESQYGDALDASFNFLQQRSPDRSKLDVILWLREQCEATIVEAAKASKQ